MKVLPMYRFLTSPSVYGIPLWAAKPCAAGMPDSGTGTTTSASAGASSASRPPHPLPGRLDRLAVEQRVGPGEIDELEEAQPGLASLERAQAADAGGIDDHHLARLDLAHEGGADQVEGGGLRGEHPAVARGAVPDREAGTREGRAPR